MAPKRLLLSCDNKKKEIAWKRRLRINIEDEEEAKGEKGVEG